MDNNRWTDRNRWALYIIAFVVALMPILLLRDLTPDNETRYLTIVDEALRDHTFFTFHLDGEIYADKPPLYFWLMMLSKWVCGGYCPWLMILLFSVLPAVGIVRIMDKWMAGYVAEEWRLPATMMTLTSAFIIASAVVLRMDMLMTLFIVLAMRSFWRIRYQGDDAQHVARLEQWLFPLYLFLALFSKGPIGLLMPLVGTITFLIAKGEIRQIGRYWGWRTWAVLLSLCAVWFSCVYAEGGSEYLNNILFHQTMGRAVNSFRHSHSVFYYCGAIWYIIFPWSVAVVGSIIGSLRHREGRSDMEDFLICVTLSTFVMLSVISSKLQVYMLPAIPFFIYSCAIALPRHGEKVWLRAGLTAPVVGYVLALPGLYVAAHIDGLKYLGSAWLYATACVLTVSGVFALMKLWGAKTDTNVAIQAMAIGFTTGLCVGGFGVPSLPF